MQIGNRLSNGPLRVQSNVFITEYSATRRNALVSGDMSVSLSARESVNQGGTADNVYSSLTEIVSVRDFVFFGGSLL